MSFTTALSLFLFVLPNFAPNASPPQEQVHKATNGIEYKMSAVNDTRIQFPRLIAYKNVAVANRVNAQIDELTNELRCAEPRGKDDSYEVFSRVEYAAQDIFSIYASANYYCGGPYPTNDANISLTFDLRTGENVEFAELFKNYEANRDGILKVIFAEQLARTKRLVAAGKTSGENCEDDPSLFTLEVLRDSAYAYNFSEKGLMVQPQWPHAVEACAERVTTPYKQLKEFAAPDGILARPNQ